MKKSHSGYIQVNSGQRRSLHFCDLAYNKLPLSQILSFSNFRFRVTSRDLLQDQDPAANI